MGAADLENFGVESGKIHSAPRYAINGVEVTKAQAVAAMGGGPLSDDSDHWHLTAVGDEGFVARVKGDLGRLAPEARAKLHFQGYGPADWPVAQFKLAEGVTLRRPSATRVSADVGSIPRAAYTPEKLAALLSAPGGPLPAPQPQPQPQPEPTPSPVNPDVSGWLAAVVAAVIALVLYLRRK